MKPKIASAWGWSRGRLQQRRTFVLYAVIGVSGMVLDLVVFVLLVNVLEVNPVLATIISTSVGIINNFLWNAFVNFKQRDRLLARFVSFYSVGVFGIALSGLALLVFSEIFRLNPTAVKVLTIPPIVLGQYFLNKHVSFGRLPSVRRLAKWAYGHKWLLALNVVFAVLSLSLVQNIPYSHTGLGGPDEHQHYGMNVQFILEQHRLPVAGRDDLQSLQACRDNPYGKVQCTYSYQYTPQVNYLVAAVFAKIGSYASVSWLVAARVASTVFGLVFLNCLYLIGRFFLGKKEALLLTAMIGFIPQLIFTSSYVNQDAYSLAVAGVLVYSSFGYIMRRRRVLRWVFYVSFALLFTSKYNFFILAVVPLVFLFAQAWPRGAWRKMGVQLLWMGGACAVLALPWFVRNMALYHDVLGQRYVIQLMAQYHVPGRAWSPLNPNSYLLLFKFDSFNALFKSFIAQFGYLYVPLNEGVYTVTKFVWIVGAVVLARFASRRGRLVLLGLAVFAGLAFVQVLFNSFIFDWQMQGRYLFVVLPVAGLALAYVLADIKRRLPAITEGFLLAGVSVTILLVVESIIALGTNIVVLRGL